MSQEWINALIGGSLIGLAVSIMLLFNGRVTGISGIISGILKPVKGDTLWRVLFIIGLVAGGFIISALNPDVFNGDIEISLGTTALAGLLVGFGTVMGSGCTSGHGVCGISRLSIRSLLATITFMIAGILTVTLIRVFGLLN